MATKIRRGDKFFGTQGTSLMCDNQNSIKLTKNHVFHARTKHIEVQYHFIKGKVRNGKIKLTHVSTNEQLANMFTKPLGIIKFE